MATAAGSSSSTSSKMRLRELYRIIDDNPHTWLRRRGLIGDFSDEDCGKCRTGRMKLVKDSSYGKDGHCWRCSNRKCNSKVRIRRGSWFEKSHLLISQVLLLTYFWVYECNQKYVMHECAIAPHTVVYWFYFCREVCAIILEEESTQIGGPGEVVEVDESKFGKRKYNRGRRVDGVWVFGGIDRRTRQCFLVPVKDRKAETLIPIIERYIKPGTKIITDCWSSYSSLERFGYVHGTVNHSYEFVNSETGDHTQNIESTLQTIKRFLPCGGTIIKCTNHILRNFSFSASTYKIAMTCTLLSLTRLNLCTVPLFITESLVIPILSASTRPAAFQPVLFRTNGVLYRPF